MVVNRIKTVIFVSIFFILAIGAITHVFGQGLESLNKSERGIVGKLGMPSRRSTGDGNIILEYIHAHNVNTQRVTDEAYIIRWDRCIASLDIYEYTTKEKAIYWLTDWCKFFKDYDHSFGANQGEFVFTGDGLRITVSFTRRHNYEVTIKTEELQ